MFVIEWIAVGIKEGTKNKAVYIENRFRKMK